MARWWGCWFLPGPATGSQMLDIVFTFVYGNGVAKDKGETNVIR